MTTSKQPTNANKSKEIVDIESVQLVPRQDENESLCAIPLVRHWLFSTNKAKTRYREIRIPTLYKGVSLTQTIRIGDKDAKIGYGYGILKVKHQNMLFALQDLWQRQGGNMVRIDGTKNGVINTTSFELENTLFRSRGGKQSKMLRSLLQELSSIPVSIKNYIDEKGDVIDISVSGLINGVEFREKNVEDGKDKQNDSTPSITIFLGTMITNAFARSAVKPINMAMLASFDTDIAELLYAKIDYYLSANESTELRLDALVEKLGLEDRQLRTKNYRREKFTQAVNELNGRQLTTDNCVIDAKIIPTADGKDYKIVLKRKEIEKNDFE